MLAPKSQRTRENSSVNGAALLVCSVGIRGKNARSPHAGSGQAAQYCLDKGNHPTGKKRVSLLAQRSCRSEERFVIEGLQADSTHAFALSKQYWQAAPLHSRRMEWPCLSCCLRRNISFRQRQKAGQPGAVYSVPNLEAKEKFPKRARK